MPAGGTVLDTEVGYGLPQPPEKPQRSLHVLPQAFAEALQDTKWRGPDAFVFRGTLDEDATGWKTHIAEDIYPSQPNVRYVGLLYNPEVFRDESLWHLEEIGPYVVATRNE